MERRVQSLGINSKNVIEQVRRGKALADDRANFTHKHPARNSGDFRRRWKVWGARFHSGCGSHTFKTHNIHTHGTCSPGALRGRSAPHSP